MNVLHLRASNFYGGPERQLHFHARCAAASEFRVVVASFAESGQRPEFLDRIAEDGLPTRVLDVRSAYDPRTVAELQRVLREESIDLVCSHEYRSNLVTWAARRRAGVRWVAFSRGSTRENLKIRLYHALDRVALPRADHVVAVSRAEKAKLLRTGLRDDFVTVVPNSIDVDRLRDRPAVDLRARYGWPADSFVVICGGRFSAEKGQTDLVYSAFEALQSEPRLRFALFGDGPQRELLLAEIARRGLSDVIVCPGFERELLGCLLGADLLVNPSLSEGLPNIVLEAMALSVPVVATAVGGVPELIESGRNGWLVRAEDRPALTRGMLEAASDPSRARAMAEAALVVVREEYGFDQQMQKLAEVYRRVGEL